jgi:ring-1,2-phenylacetyl-CoA epoxidase subunit PaaD
MVTTEVELAWELLAQVPDPELPTVSVVDLGIARDVHYADGRLVVTITPTYSGCPAMREIETDVHARLSERFADVEVRTVLSPPWTTDWITEDGRRKLAGSGIAPPGVRMLPLPSTLEKPWRAHVAYVLEEATLPVPPDPYWQRGGRQGRYSEHLGYLLAEMQVVHRAHPGAQW